jgi:glutaredoxin-related protein
MKRCRAAGIVWNIYCNFFFIYFSDRASQCSKHVEEYNKLIIKQEFVHLVGQLLRLYVEILKLQSHEPTVMIIYL